jgi:hypothetical protein
LPTLSRLRGTTYAELDGDGEEVDASLLADLLAARNAGEVDVAGLDEALDASGSLEELLGEPRRRSAPRRLQAIVV